MFGEDKNTKNRKRESIDTVLRLKCFLYEPMVKEKMI
jgi:hypothetical protein